MPVNWKDPEAFTRLLAAMVAAENLKPDYRKIATYYGNGATYDSIEGRFRIIKREAAALKAEIDSGSRPEAPPRGANNTPASTPKKPRSTNAAGTPKEKTIGGRVVKKETAGTPSKKGKVKVEEDEGNAGNRNGTGAESLYLGENGMDDSVGWTEEMMAGFAGADDAFDGLDVGV